MIGYNNHRGLHFLQALHNNPDRPPMTKTDRAAIEPTDVNIKQIDCLKHIRELAQNDALVMKLKTLKPGTWFNFNAKSTNPLRAKLAPANNHTLHFMYVNNIGQKTALTSTE